jgi:hypothetical protein
MRTISLVTLGAALAAGGLGVAGCGHVAPDPGEVPCGPAGECPDDFECRSDDHCYPAGGTLCAADSCDANATCADVTGMPVCTCVDGFDGPGTTCTDIDECADGADDCHADATCVNTAGSFDCACNPGFTGDGWSCVDIDECATSALACGVNAHCVNQPGTASCECDPGFQGDATMQCDDIDECALAICSPLAFCTNSVGSFDCVCRGGYLDPAGDGTSCVKSGDGHVVFLGHDLFERNADIDRLVGNAVLLANTTGQVEVLGFTQFADTTPTGEVANTDAAIQARVAERGREVVITPLVDHAQLAAALAGKHVLLLYEQELGLPDFTTAWAPILHEFVGAGGVVVVHSYFDDTWRLTSATHLIGCGSATGSASGAVIAVVDAADPVALDVNPTYLGAEGSAFRGCNDGVVVAAHAGSGNAVVVHKTHARPITGHGVLMGHDLFERGPGVDRVIGNAAFVANTQGTVQVLGWTQFADGTPTGEVVNANAAIQQRAAELGRAATITAVADSTQIAAQLAGKDVLLIYEQETTSIDVLRTHATALQPALTAFLVRGGTVVVMDHNGGGGGTWELANTGGVLTATGVNSVFGVAAEVADPLDPLAIDLPSPYPATNGSVTFSGADAAAAVVSRDPATLLPFVLHRTRYP